MRHWFEQLPIAAPSVQARWATANAVEDGIGEGGIADDLVPGVDGKLAGDQRGTGAVSVFDDLHQVAPLARSKAIRPPVINDQQVRFGQVPKLPRVTAIRCPHPSPGRRLRSNLRRGPVRKFQLAEQPWRALANDDGGVVAARLRPTTQANHVLPTPPDQSKDWGR